MKPMHQEMPTGLAVWRAERQGGYAHWSAPVVLLAHLDAPVAGGLLVGGNLRVEGWAFWIDGKGEARPAQLELWSQGQRLACAALAVDRHDVNAAHGLPPTAPLGFRILPDSPYLGSELEVVVIVEEGNCILARLALQPQPINLLQILEQGMQALDLRETTSRPEGVGVRPQLGEGHPWDGSVAVGAFQLREALDCDLQRLWQVLPASLADAEGGSSGCAGGAASEVLTLLARRYGLPLLQLLMAKVNQRWLAPRELEFTQHGLQRTFRFWSGPEKQRAMEITSEALHLWQMAGIPCFHTFGTLLGLVREGDLLPHDDDIDAVALVSVEPDETPEQAVAALERRLQMLGHATKGAYRFHRHVEHRGFWFDLFVATVDGEEVTFWGTKIWTTTRARLLPVQRQAPGGLISVQPADPEHVVEGIYGRDWRTPRPYHYIAIQRALGSGSHSAARLRVVEEQQP